MTCTFLAWENKYDTLIEFIRVNITPRRLAREYQDELRKRIEAFKKIFRKKDKKVRRRRLFRHHILPSPATYNRHRWLTLPTDRIFPSMSVRVDSKTILVILPVCPSFLGFPSINHAAVSTKTTRFPSRNTDPLSFHAPSLHQDAFKAPS